MVAGGFPRTRSLDVGAADVERHGEVAKGARADSIDDVLAQVRIYSSDDVAAGVVVEGHLVEEVEEVVRYHNRAAPYLLLEGACMHARIV